MDLNLRQELAAVTARIAALGSTGDLARLCNASARVSPMMSSNVTERNT